MANESQREQIRRLRHAVYAVELRQHAENNRGELSDDLDRFNVQIAASRGDSLLGFITITPPEGGRFSIDKYFARSEIPFELDDRAFEIRLLTVPTDRRGSTLAALLMYAAFRWIESRGGERIVAIGRRELRDFYRRTGLEGHGLFARSGAVTYELMSASIDRLRERIGEARNRAILERSRSLARWALEIPFDASPSTASRSIGGGASPHDHGHDHGSVRAPSDSHADGCFHGGRAFEAIGSRFERLDLRERVIAADVLDAWFPPAPGVLRALRDELPWCVATAPPQDAAGVVRSISSSRDIPEHSIAVGAGSSTLIHRALRLWLHAKSRVLLPDPTYGEYHHVLARGIGCRVERMALRARDGFRIDPEAVIERCRSQRFDLLVLVNPNNPTGQLLSRLEIQRMAASIPPWTRIWIDEAYIDFEAPDETLEPIAAFNPRFVVCKSLSKCHALSGVRAAYLCSHETVANEIRRATPPWELSLPAQIAAIHALRDDAYSKRRHRETAALRKALVVMLAERLPELELLGSGANFVLLGLPAGGADASSFCDACAGLGLFVRDAGRTSPVLGTHSIRIAVKDAATNERMVTLLSMALESGRARSCRVRKVGEQPARVA